MSNNLYRQFLMPFHKFVCLLWIIQVSKQYGNCDYCFHGNFQLLLRHFGILARTCVFFGEFIGQYLKGDLQMSIYDLQVYLIYLHSCDCWVDPPPPTLICRALPDLVKRWDFLLLSFKYLFWNIVKTIKTSFEGLINTKSKFASHAKE